MGVVRRGIVGAITAVGLQGPARTIRRQTPRLRRARTTRQAFYRQFISPGDLCFDVGANEGNRVEAFVSLGARVVAVEPQVRCYERLRRFERAGVVVVPMGVAAAPGRLRLRDSTAHTLATMSSDFIDRTTAAGRFRTEMWREGYDVEVTTLDALIDLYGEPSFVKIDVEGFEYQVLLGLSRPLRALSFEYTAELVDITAACIAHLLSLDEYVFSYAPTETMQLASEWISGPALLRELSGLESGQAWGDVYATSLRRGVRPRR